MRRLTEQDVIDILHGCAILGTGGGGSLSGGLEIVARDIAAGRPFHLVSLGELADDSLVACPYAAGCVSPETEEGRARYAHLPRIEDSEALAAFTALEEHLGERIDAVLTTELGAENTADAFSVAARLGRVIVDADPAGRSVPELQHSTLAMHKVPITPLAVATRFGDVAILPRVADDQRAEALVRAMSVVSQDVVGVADHPVRARDLNGTVIEGAVSQAWRLGSVLRTASGDVPAAVAAEGGGEVRFRGRVTDLDWATQDGFTVGEVVLTGSGPDAGHHYRVHFRNEHLIAWRDDVVDLSVPDLICVLTAEGEPVTNPELEHGAEHVVIGLPAPALWTTAAGLDLFGPRSFGFDHEWQPLRPR